MKKTLQSTVFLIVVITFAACSGKKEENKAAAPAPVKYNLMLLSSHSMGSTVQLPGVMIPYQFVQLYPKVNGFVKYVPVDRGSIVKKGQLLITLEAPEIEQNVAAAKLKYTQALADYATSRDRYDRLLETSKTPGTVSVFDLQAARSKKEGDSAMVQGEYANYKAQEAMRSYLTVDAPFDGVITERNVHPGALVGPGAQNDKPMLVLQQLSRLRLTVDIPEQYAVQINDGDTVHYKVNALPGQDFTGTVSRASNNLNSSYRSETIEIDVFNTKNIFKPGMYAEVVLPTSGSSNAFVVPKSAVVTTTERRYVIVADNSIARWVDVSEGNQSTDSTEIFGDLHNGQQVVVNGSYQVKEGDRVE